jgi:hypothetical protein
MVTAALLALWAERRAIRRVAGAPRGGAGGADDQFSDDLPAMATGVINWVVYEL